jgi:hypothetical protein
MKNFHAAASGLILFAGGLILGREIFPANPGSSEHPESTSLSTRSNPSPRVISTPSPTTEDTANLLNLVNLNDPFGTNRALGKSLEKLNSIQLRDLLTDLERSSKDNPKFQTTRTQIFNHLALADPHLALETLLASTDDYFKQSHLSIVIHQLAKTDFSAARIAVQNITDKGLKTTALNQLIDAAMDYSPQSMVELMAEAQIEPNSAISFGYDGAWGTYQWGSHFQSPTFFNSNSALSKWAAKDPAAATAYAMDIKDPTQRSSALSSIASARAQTDPEGALAWVQGLTGKEREQGLSSVLLVMASKDPAKVSGMLDQLSDHNQQASLINSIAQYWMQLDPTAGLAWIQNLPGGQTKQQALANAFRIVSQDDPRAGVALLDELPANIRQQNLNQLAQSWAQKDLSAAKTWITSLQNPFDLKVGLEGLVPTWAAQDPAGAAAFVRSSDVLPEKERSRQINTIAGTWAAKDPGSALRWVMEIEHEDTRANAISQVYSHWASNDPSEAARQVPALTNPKEQQYAISTILSTWTYRDPDAALQWFHQLPREDRFKNAAQLISSLSSQSPENAALQFSRLSAEAGGDEKLQEQLQHSATSLASTWSNQDVEAAAEWASGLNEGLARQRALGEIASRWANLDPVEASGWIDNLTDGKARDSGVKTLVEKFKEIDPASAFDWAQTLSSDSNRISSVRSVLQDWKQTDEAAAKQAYSNAVLTEKQREQIDYIFK